MVEDFWIWLEEEEITIEDPVPIGKTHALKRYELAVMGEVLSSKTLVKSPLNDAIFF